MKSLRTLALPLMLAAMLASPLTGCGNIAYYAQAVGGHFDVMGATRPIVDIIRDPASDPVLRRQLEDVLAIREFASRELALPDNNSYRSYADLGRPYVVWNVFAAPEFSLQPKSWCMLMVGCVNYRGYYAREDAERLAADLRQDGYDTYVGGVTAYSTLGWFDDPVLNTFMSKGTLEVARIVFHELVHQLVFVKNDSTFNESFATAVENEGMSRWMVKHATAGQRAAFEAQRALKAGFAKLMQDYRKKFEALYAMPGPDGPRRQAKAELLDALRRDYAELLAGPGHHPGDGKLPGAEFNNARLVSFSLYHQLVPAFEVLLDQENHDLAHFYRRVVELAALDKEARCRALTALLPPAGDSGQARRCVDAGTKVNP